METVLVRIGTDARVTIQAHGVTGPGCHDLTRGLERALGQTVADRPTAEFFQEESVHVGNAARGG